MPEGRHELRQRGRGRAYRPRAPVGGGGVDNAWKEKELFSPKEDMGTIVGLFLSRGGDVRGHCGSVISSFPGTETAETTDPVQMGICTHWEQTPGNIRRHVAL